jgi:RNA polymerase sigma factor (sigma-70 family)
MPTNHASKVVQHVRRAVLGNRATLSDGQLLGCFIERRDESAFAALVKRHGQMVWGVCRRILHNHQDAEDAFQATFLVLVRKATSIVPRDMLGNWLYGVGVQTAVRLRSAIARRRTREKQVPMPEPAAAEQDLANDLQPVLDQELARLPDKYRLAVVLCDLEGNTYQVAAQQLGCPAGTLAARLSRARRMLAKRLTRRGVTVSGGALAAVLAEQASACPISVVASTISATATGQAASTKVAALADGVIKAMLVTKLKKALAILLVLGFIGSWATCRSAGQVTGDKALAADKQEGVIAWGKEIGGLQAGLGIRNAKARAYHYGEMVTMVIRLRNVSNEVVKFSYLQPFIEHSPTVTIGDGKSVPQPNIIPDIGERDAGVVELPPGKEIDLHEMKRQLRPASEGNSNKSMRPYALYGTGKIGVRYEQVLGTPEMGRPQWKLDPALAKLATGMLQLDVKDRVYTPDELLKTAKSLAADAKVVVQFKVRLVQPSVQIRKEPGEHADWVVGHGRDDLGLHPMERLDYTNDQFAVLLTAKAKQQFTRLGIRDVGKHLLGKSIRVTGPITSFVPITDEPISGRQYEIILTDVSQLEVAVGP